jgi:hypothetical protein
MSRCRYTILGNNLDRCIHIKRFHKFRKGLGLSVGLLRRMRFYIVGCKHIFLKFRSSYVKICEPRSFHVDCPLSRSDVRGKASDVTNLTHPWN